MAYAFSSTRDVANPGSGTTQTTSVTYSLHDRAEGSITYGSATTVAETFSDGTNTYSLVKTVNDATNFQTTSTYECKDCAAGTFTVTAGPTSAQLYRNVVVTIYSGLDNAAANANSGTNNSAPGSGTDAVTSTNATPGAQPAMLFSHSMDSSGSETTLTAGTGFTNRGTMANTETAIGVKTRIEDRRLTSTSAVAGTFTAGSGSGRFLTFAVIVPEPGGGGGGTPLFRQSLLNGIGAGGKFFNNPLG